MDTNTETIIDNPFTERLKNADSATATIERPKPKTGILAQITSRKRRRPIFGVVYGPPGIGKSTFGASAPEPVFLQVERGLDQITVPKLPIPKSFAQLYAQIDALDKEEHEFKTIVLDTLDATEVLIWERVCSEGKVKSLEEYGGGYGKGYSRAREIWVGLMNKLSDMNERFNILLLAHSQLKPINDPMLLGTYDQHRIKIHEKSADIIRQAVDLILFANLDITLAKDTPKAKKGRALLSGDRLLWTEPAQGVEAKNRFGLPAQLPFEWAALEKGIDDFYGSAKGDKLAA